VLRLSDELIARCEAAGVTYSAGIVTNGYFLDEATSRALRERRVTDVQVGLDGPPDVHDRMRPLRGGQGTFWRIIENLRVAVEHLEIAIRVNLDATNVERAEELLQILVAEGFAGKLTVYPGQLVTGDEGIGAPSATYAPPCLTRPEFAAAELAFNAMAIDYGFASPGLPSPSGAPCTAVRQNELVIGSKGEIYKCWDSVGNASEALGNIRDHMLPDTRLSKWLHYDPFVDSECRSCIALPVCMGGCAHHAMVPSQYDNRCGTFRHTYAEQVAAFVERAESRLAGRRDAPLQLIRRMETR
jgi:uncharacterized protein